MKTERWEQGSELQLLNAVGCEPVTHPWRQRFRSYASGRDAFHALLCHGMAKRSWKRLLVPSYYCQKVVASLAQSGIELVLYEDGPDMKEPAIDASVLRPGDVLLLVNFLGLRLKPALPPGIRPRIEIIEDHTHDPWSDWAQNSDADWCVASLRKTLPVPDGGVLWSPAGNDLPPQLPASPDRENASLNRLAAMLLKAMYVDGGQVEKDEFRKLYQRAEQALDEAEASGMTEWAAAICRSLPVEVLRQRRRWNRCVLCRELEGLDGMRILHPDDDEAACALSCVLVFDTPALRDAVRGRLMVERIYTAVLWPLDETVLNGVPARHQRLSQTMLSVHCDMRYSDADMVRVARTIRHVMEEQGDRLLFADSCTGGAVRVTERAILH